MSLLAPVRQNRRDKEKATLGQLWLHKLPLLVSPSPCLLVYPTPEHRSEGRKTPPATSSCSPIRAACWKPMSPPPHAGPWRTHGSSPWLWMRTDRRRGVNGSMAVPPTAAPSSWTARSPRRSSRHNLSRSQENICHRGLVMSNPSVFRSVSVSG